MLSLLSTAQLTEQRNGFRNITLSISPFQHNPIRPDQGINLSLRLPQTRRPSWHKNRFWSSPKGNRDSPLLILSFHQDLHDRRCHQLPFLILKALTVISGSYSEVHGGFTAQTRWTSTGFDPWYIIELKSVPRITQSGLWFQWPRRSLILGSPLSRVSLLSLKHSQPWPASMFY